MIIETSFIFLAFGVILALLIFKGVKIVPQQQVWILEKFGKFDRKLEPGLNFIIPYIEKIGYKHTLKEEAVEVHEQTAITNDNVTLLIDGVLYVRIIDPIAASYGIQHPYFAIEQLAQTTMRSEIGKMTMDRTFEERDVMNSNIVRAINEASQSWGIQCMRYEIKDIKPPATVLKAMELQVAAERQKRAEILESEGRKQSKINLAEAEKQEVVLRSEAAMIDQINRAKGEAEARILVAEANAKGIEIVGESIRTQGGSEAVSLKIAEQYVSAFGNLAKLGTTVVVPASVNDAGSMVAQALGIFNSMREKQG
jgi:regulator of protease activity HflC (stomatin/prohibitin superfamily)